MRMRASIIRKRISRGYSIRYRTNFFYVASMGYEKKCMLLFCGAVGGSVRFNFKITVMGVGSDDTIFSGPRVGWSARAENEMMISIDAHMKILLSASMKYEKIRFFDHFRSRSGS